MHSKVIIKSVSWPHFSWPTLYMSYRQLFYLGPMQTCIRVRSFCCVINCKWTIKKQTPTWRASVLCDSVPSTSRLFWSKCCCQHTRKPLLHVQLVDISANAQPATQVSEAFAMIMSAVAPEAFQKWGPQIPAPSAGKFFLLCLPYFFVVPPMTGQSAGHSNKDWAWAELADRTRPKRSLTFQSGCVKGDLASR